MKLWKRFIIGWSSIFIILGTTITGIYFYSQQKKIKGIKHTTNEPMQIRLNELKDIRKYDISFRSPINTKKIIGKFELNIQTKNDKPVLGEGKINGKPAREWIEKYYKEHSQPPVMFIYAGKGIKFTNFYTEVILPNDFVRFVHWFSENIAWTPGIASISSYMIKRGVKKNDNNYTLGSYSAVKGERKEIKFIPDSFYKEISFARYVTKLNEKPLTKDEVKTLVREINEQNKDQKDESKKIIPYSIEKNYEGNYDLYISNIGSSLINIAKKLYSSQVVVSDLDIELDKTGKVVLSEKKSIKIRNNSVISKLSFLRAIALPNKWQGIGLNFLKYLTAHEYGHMQTLSMAMNINGKPVSLEPSDNVEPNAAVPTKQLDIDVLNSYFDARIPFIRAKRVSPTLYQDPNTKKYRYLTYQEAFEISKRENKPKPSPYDFMNIAFEVDNNPQITNDKNTMVTINKIFAGTPDPTNPNNMLFNHAKDDKEFAKELEIIINQIKNAIEKNENHFQFLMRDVKDVSAFAKFLKVPVAAIMFMNANDNYLATVSPSFFAGIQNIPFGKQLAKNEENKWVWVDDNVFAIKALDNKTPWFVKEKPDMSKYKIKKSEDEIDEEEFFVDSLSTETTWYINPKAAEANGIKSENIGKYLKSFKTWFENKLLDQDEYEISGNYYFHNEWMNFQLLSKNIMFKNNFFFIDNEYKIEIEDFTKIFDELNTISKVSRHSSSIFPTGDALPIFWDKGIPIIDSHTIENGEQFNYFLEYINLGGKYNPYSIYNIIDVINQKRLVSGSIIDDGDIKRNKMPFYNILELMGGHLNIANQKLFKIFTNQNNMLFLMYEDSDEKKPLVSQIAWDNNQLNEWKSEIIRLDSNEDISKIKEISEARSKVIKILLKKAQYLKFNSNSENLQNIGFKVFEFKKLFNLIYLNIDQTISGSTFISLNDAQLGEYINGDISSLDNNKKKRFRETHYNHLFDGFEDFELNQAKFKKLFTLFEKMGSNGFKNNYLKAFAKNLIPKVFNTETGKLNNDALIKVFNNIKKLKKAYDFSNKIYPIKTLSALQFIFSGTSKVLSDFWGDPVHIQTYDYAPIKDWINNAWEGAAAQLANIFSNYTFLWSEVLTRDWVQMTYIPNQDLDDESKKYRYGSQYTNIVEGKSGIELYLNPKKIIDKNSLLYKWIVDEEKSFDNFLNLEQTKTNFLDNLKKKKLAILKKMPSEYANNIQNYIYDDFNEIIMNDGYYKDRWLRAMLKDEFSGNGINSWVIYDDNGRPIIDPNIKTKKAIVDSKTGKITFQKLQGHEQNRANAFWWWLLQTYGVGNRTITGLWRVPEKNAFTMWGYLSNYLAKRVKYIKFTKGKKVKYIPINIKNTNNLFYLKHQGDSTSKHFLNDDGFSSWTIDMLTAGTWIDSFLENGKWNVEFVDDQKKLVIDPTTNKNAFSLGDEKLPGGTSILTINNKHRSYAPIRIENQDGKPILIVRENFAI